MDNIKLIKTTVQSGKSAAVLALLHRFIDSRSLSSCRELITEIMLPQDIEDVHKPDGEQFLRDVLNGNGWTGYNQLSFTQIIQEFDNRQLFTDYFYFDLDLDSSNLLRNRLLALATEAQSLQVPNFSVLVVVRQGVTEEVRLFDDRLEAIRIYNQIGDNYHLEDDDLQIFRVPITPLTPLHKKVTDNPSQLTQSPD